MTLAIDLRHVSFGYGNKTALDNISIATEPGIFCALLGPNGAGKSTLFSLLTRLSTPKTGSIRVAGIELNRNPRKALVQIGVVFQQSTLDLDMTVWQNMSYFAGLHGLSGSMARRRIEAALEQLGMAERLGDKVRVLNGGHRRRMEIARALIHDPQVLLLDEPTVGLDPASRHAITRHVHKLADTGVAVLWATHLVDEIAPNDELIVLHRGEILAQDKAANIAGERPLADKFLEMTAVGLGE